MPLNLSVHIGSISNNSFTPSVSDAVGVTDLANDVWALARTSADPVGITDSANDVWAIVRTQADAVGITDSCSAVLNVGAFPDATNTGIAGIGVSRASLAAGGAGGTFTTPGQTISGKLFTGNVTLNGDNSTLSGCQIEDSGSSEQVIIVGGNNVTIEDCTILAASGSFYIGIHCNNGSGTQVLRCNISLGENLMTIEADSVTVQDSYLHDTSLASNPTGHADVIEVYGGSGHTIKHNTLKQTAALGDSPINIAPWQGTTSVNGVAITDNFIDGGNSHILVDLQSTGTIHNVSVLRNQMGGHTDNGIYSAFQDNDSRGTVETPTAQTSNPNALLWPQLSGNPDINLWEQCTGLSPDKTGQIVTA